MECKECGKSFYYTDSETFCPQCEVKYKKRNEFREIMNKLSKISDLEREDFSFMTGFSYAEMERFSLIFKKIQNRAHFPSKMEEFVNTNAIKEASKLFI